VAVPALRVEIVAQARHYSRVVPDTGTILTGSGRTWTVLFRAVPGLAHRVSAKWPSILEGFKATTITNLQTTRYYNTTVPIAHFRVIFLRSPLMGVPEFQKTSDQHESFVCTLSSLVHTRKNFLVGHPSQDCSELSTFNLEVISR
jgi:hypothetical protein